MSPDDKLPLPVAEARLGAALQTALTPAVLEVPGVHCVVMNPPGGHEVEQLAST